MSRRSISKRAVVAMLAALAVALAPAPAHCQAVRRGSEDPQQGLVTRSQHELIDDFGLLLTRRTRRGRGLDGLVLGVYSEPPAAVVCLLSLRETRGIAFDSRLCQGTSPP